ncbi:MAG TPA: UbiA family prenyltransferase [Candidatus Limnocylindrales bacterium]|nr:UbiA family prenyltransferase [Candidatus Limnocylindrales bacterium]
MSPLVRIIHPAPTFAVVTLAGALAAILSIEAGRSAFDTRVVLVTLSVLGSQILTGALNDWADRARDALVQPTKPIPSGRVAPRTALTVAGFGLAVQVAGSVPLGAALILGLIASASAVAYNLWLSRGAASFLPYLVSFGLLPVWIAAGVGAPLERVAAAPLLVGPFAVAAHLANTVRDFDADARIGSGNIAQRLGRRTAFALAWGLAMATGIGVGTVFVIGAGVDATSLVLGAIGIAAVAQGITGPARLWGGMLVAAVCWTAAWALATG